MPATAIAISTIAIAQSNLAIAEAEAAKTLACKGFVRGYQNDTASTVQMKEYAACVERLYPDPVSSGIEILIKVSVVLAIVSIPIGAWAIGRDLRDGPMGYVLGAFMGPVVTAAVVGSAALIYVGARYVFS